jgi:hypothetical protein
MKRVSRIILAGLIAGMAIGVVGPTWAAEDKPADTQPKPAAATVAQVMKKMSATIDKVDIQNATTKEAFKWWSDTTGVKILIDWDAMAAEGVTPTAPVNLELREVPAGVVLGLIMQKASPDTDLIYQVTPWYVQIMTKKQANKFNVLKVYEVGDLVHDASVGPAPGVGLMAWSPRSVPGVSAYGPTVVGTVDVKQSWAGAKSNQGMGEELADVIKSQIEPEVWQDKGGKATIRFFRGTLVVSAPEYVHAQIGYAPRGGERPMVFLNKREKIDAAPVVRVQEAGVVQSHEVESTSIGVGVGVTIRK